MYIVIFYKKLTSATTQVSHFKSFYKRHPVLFYQIFFKKSRSDKMKKLKEKKIGILKELKISDLKEMKLDDLKILKIEIEKTIKEKES
jgi:hypothetical protein|nr:MAG TPA: hypothetical protein [Caudoviricetes sp.]